jgi:iron complex transport system substrate-binding protein
MYRTAVLFSIVIIFFGNSCFLDDSLGQKESQVLHEPTVFERAGFRIAKTETGMAVEDPFRASSISKVVVPSSRVILSSTTQLCYFQALDALDLVVGCPWLDFVKDTVIQQRRELGLLHDVTKGASLDLERVISLRPDVLLYDPRSMDIVERLENAGVRCIPFFEYQETDPLDRLAWLDLIGLLTAREEAATLIFDSIQTAYKSAQVVIDEVKPKVLFGSFYQGVWSAAGGASLIARMIEDAGGEYIIPGNESAAVDLDLEEFLHVLAEVDFIGMIQQGELSRKDWLALDPRIEKSMIEDKVIFYSNTLESDYFGKGILEPHIMLADIVSIMNGEQKEHGYFQLAE